MENSRYVHVQWTIASLMYQQKENSFMYKWSHVNVQLSSGARFPAFLFGFRGSGIYAEPTSGGSGTIMRGNSVAGDIRAKSGQLAHLH